VPARHRPRRCTSPLHKIQLPVLPAPPRRAVAHAAAGSAPLGEGEEGAAAASIAGEGRSATVEGSRCITTSCAPTMVCPLLLCRIHCVRARPTAPVLDPSRHSPPGHHAPTSNAPRRVRIECTLPRPLLHLPRRLAPPAAPVGERERGAIDAGPIGFPSDMATSQGPPGLAHGQKQEEVQRSLH
jgi:hypothetical protein